jgi:hypothetical protein
MVIIPKEKPAIENINSFYVKVERMLEHYQGEMIAGGVHFKSITAEGAVFFDNSAVLGGVYKNGNTKLTGGEAIDRIISDCRDTNYTISVYEVDPARIYYWSNIPSAQRIYDNLSTEFTDLQGLIKKMGKEKLTGYIEVDMAADDKRAWVFFHNGMIIGGLDSWERFNLDRSSEYLKQLIGLTKKTGGVFHVSKVVMGQETPVSAPASADADVQEQIETLLTKFEDLLKSKNLNKSDFDRDFKKKLVAHADRFGFLDPFAGEFQYGSGKFLFEGEVDDKELVEGTLTCVAELATEKGVIDEIKEDMRQLLNTYGQGTTIKGLE